MPSPRFLFMDGNAPYGEQEGGSAIFWAVLQGESLLWQNFIWAFGGWRLKNARQSTQMSGQASKSRLDFCKTVQKMRFARSDRLGAMSASHGIAYVLYKWYQQSNNISERLL